MGSATRPRTGWPTFWILSSLSRTTWTAVPFGTVREMVSLDEGFLAATATLEEGSLELTSCAGQGVESKSEKPTNNAESGNFLEPGFICVSPCGPGCFVDIDIWVHRCRKRCLRCIGGMRHRPAPAYNSVWASGPCACDKIRESRTIGGQNGRESGLGGGRNWWIRAGGEFGVCRKGRESNRHISEARGFG